jgi:hypothetical protein
MGDVGWGDIFRKEGSILISSLNLYRCQGKGFCAYSTKNQYSVAKLVYGSGRTLRIDHIMGYLGWEVYDLAA